MKPHNPDYPQFTYGYLERVGVVKNTALVIIGYKAGKHWKPGWRGVEYFSAFNYNLAAESPSKIAGLEYVWFWKLFRLARFEPSDAPDVVFTYYPCWECEAPKVLSSLNYDQATGQWQLRRWMGPKDWATSTALFVEQDLEPGDNLASSDDLYGLVDLNAKGFDEVAMRSSWVTKRANKIHVDDLTVDYDVKNSHFSGKFVTNQQEQLKVWSQLCVKSPSQLCKGVPTLK